jgi:hypothetical protein
MKRKPIKIDWDELEDAFSSSQLEAASYLDRITGRVVLEGEGEEAELDEGDAGFEPATAVARAVSGSPPEDPTRLAIRPPDIPRKIEWMNSFLRQTSSEHPPDVAAAITAAMGVENPTPVIKGILDRNPEVRDAWYLYRSERIQEMIDGWLAENGVDTTDPPPWKT